MRNFPSPIPPVPHFAVVSLQSLPPSFPLLFHHSYPLVPGAAAVRRRRQPLRPEAEASR